MSDRPLVDFPITWAETLLAAIQWGINMAFTSELRNEVATVAKDITQPVFGGILLPNDDTLLTRGGSQGLKIYDQIERDTHAFAVLQKRKMSIIGREWDVEPASSSRVDKKAADVVKYQLENLALNVPDDEVLAQCSGFDQMCLNLLDAILKGYAVGEVIWDQNGSEIFASEVKPREQRRFAFTPGIRGFKLNLKTWSNLLPGEPVPPRKFIVHSLGAKDGNPYGLGLGTRLFWPVYFKRQDITFWLTFVDKFAAPTAMGTYPAGAAPEDKAKLLGALSAIAQDSGIIVPEGTLITYLEASRSGSIDCYEKLARYMDEQISECVLGETGSTNQSGGGGSRARDEVGNSVRLELVKADSDILCATLNSTLVKWITMLNCPGATPPKVWRDCDEPEDLKTKAERDGILSKDVGITFTVGYFNREYGFEDGDIESISKQSTSPANQPAPGTKQLPGQIVPAASFAEGLEGADILSQLLDHHGSAADAAMTALVGKLRETLAGSDDLTDMRARILEAFPGLPVEELARIIAEEAIRAQMAGRLDVADGK
jgi:phage gp29-like protein